MKLPRWLVVLLMGLSVLAVLAAAGWWWVTWPDRTAREFVEYGAAGQWDKANGMLAPPGVGAGWGVLPYSFVFLDSERPFAAFAAKPRSLLDVATGKKSYVDWGRVDRRERENRHLATGKKSYADWGGFAVAVKRGQVMSAGMVIHE